MSVIVSDRKESRFEAVTFSLELHDMLIGLMQRGFCVKDLSCLVRERYRLGRNANEDYDFYRFLMQEHKIHLNQLCYQLTNDVRGANSIYPTTMDEYRKRRDFQTSAIVVCEQMIKELQRIIDVYDVDLNLYKPYTNAIDREIGLIKKWRRRDNKIKSYVG